MMKTLRLKLERMLPFMSPPRLSAPAAPGGRAVNPVAIDDLKPEHGFANVSLRRAEVADITLEQSGFYQSAFDRVLWSNVRFEACKISHSAFKDCRFSHCSMEQSSWTIVDAEACTLEKCDLRETRWVGVNLRDGNLIDCKMADSHLALSDLFGARFSGIDAKRVCLQGTDLSYTTLEAVDFTGADLRGCSFANAVVRDVNFEKARVDDCDLRGVKGLDREQRADLAARGARLWSGTTEWLVAKSLERLRPKLTPQEVDRNARRAGWGVRFGMVFLAVGFSAWLFLTGLFHPTPHGSELTSATRNTDLKRTATQEEILQTQENLERIKAALRRAYETTEADGVPRYPTEMELASNQFDRDGLGPGQEMATLVEGGLPLNFITDGEGVSSYCNEIPAQETLNGDNTDWHYCGKTGRIFACGGYTNIATLEW